MISSIKELTAQEIDEFKVNPNMLNDHIFKHIFGREEAKSSLISFLNAFLHDELEQPIKDLNYLNNESLGVLEDGKKIFFDIACTLDNGAVVDVEVQVMDNKDFSERITWYLAKLLVGATKRGQKYSRLNPAISLSILDFNLFKEDKEVFSSFGICNLKNHKRLTKLVSLNFIELRKFEKREILTTIDKWIMILSKQFSLREKREIAKGDVAMEQVLQDVDNYLVDLSNYVATINQERYEMDENSKEDYLLRKGGELRNQVIVLNMLKKGVHLNLIAECCDLSLPEIKKIAQDNGIALSN